MPPLKLEVFKTPEAQHGSTVVTDIGTLEDDRLAAYEKGYTAGWEDAAAAQASDLAQVRADLARNLQTLSFTYHEARMHVLKAIRPLLDSVVSHLLPEMAREAIAPVVLETLMPMVEDLAETPVTIVLNPSVRPALEALLAEATNLPIIISEEPTLGAGQVYLRLGPQETLIDLDRATAEISEAVRSFFGHSSKDNSNG